MEKKISNQYQSGLSLTIKPSNPSSDGSQRSNGPQRSIINGSKDRAERVNSNINSSFNTYTGSGSGGGYTQQYTINQDNPDNLLLSQNSLENMPTRKMVPGLGPQESISGSQEIGQINLNDQYNVYEEESTERNVILSKTPKHHFSRNNSKSNEVTLNHSMISIGSKSYAYSDHLPGEFNKKGSNNSNNSQRMAFEPFEFGKVSVQDFSSDQGKIEDSDIIRMEQEYKELLDKRIKDGEEYTPNVAEIYLKLADISIKSSKKLFEAQGYIEKACTACSKFSKNQDHVLFCQKIFNTLNRASKQKIDYSKYRSSVLSLLEEKVSSTLKKERAEMIIAISFEEFQESNKIISLVRLINGLKALKEALGENHLVFQERVLAAHRVIFDKKTNFEMLNRDDEIMGYIPEIKTFLEESPRYFEKAMTPVVCLLNLAKFYKDSQLYEKSLEIYSKAREIAAAQKVTFDLYSKEAESKILSLKKLVEQNEEVNKTKRKIELERHNFSQRVSEESFIDRSQYGDP